MPDHTFSKDIFPNIQSKKRGSPRCRSSCGVSWKTCWV